MVSKIAIGIIGVGLGGIIFFWFMFRLLIKEGIVKTEVPPLFLLSNKYKDKGG